MEETTIAHLLRFRGRKELTAVALIKALRGTLLFDENGEIVHFQISPYAISVWRGYDPDGLEKEKQATRKFEQAVRRSKKSGKFPEFPGAPPSAVRKALGLPDAPGRRKPGRKLG